MFTPPLLFVRVQSLLIACCKIKSHVTSCKTNYLSITKFYRYWLLALEIVRCKKQLLTRCEICSLLNTVVVWCKISRITSCKICWLLIVVITQCKKSLFAVFIVCPLQKLFVLINHLSLVGQLFRYSLLKMFVANVTHCLTQNWLVAKRHSFLVAKLACNLF